MNIKGQPTVKASVQLAIDIFSGCGGLTEGLRQAGFTVIAGVELSHIARTAYMLNHPNVRLFEDVRRLEPEELMKALDIKRGELDLLAGCPPCQGFSMLRTLNKSTPAIDDRNELIFDFLKLALGLLPKTLMLENVPGLRKDVRLDAVKRQLETAGYHCIDAVLNAAEYGVPQRRKRMILLASRFGPVELPQPLKHRRTVRDAIGSLSCRAKANRAHGLRSHHSESTLLKIAAIPKNGGSRSAWGLSGQLPCHQKPGVGFRDIYGRMAWDKVSPTITRFFYNPSKGRFLHPEENRAVTPYEAALLQSFPKSYKFPRDAGLRDIGSLIGEAFPPSMARAQAKSLIDHLRQCSGRKIPAQSPE